MQHSPTPTLLRAPTERMRPPSRPAGGPPPAPPRPRPKLKKLRLGLILFGLAVLALVSTLFGMLMAVASDLPALENQAEYRAARNSLLLGDSPTCRKDPDACPPIARLTGNRNRILLGGPQISPHLANAVIAIEDRRFYRHEGVDYKGIARAFVQDLLRQEAAQGGSTITQQFVKNALSAQGNRSLFQKLREAALAYHLERKWSKQKVITQYLNSVYFGNGAYGVEAAMRTYFGDGDGADPQAQPAEPREGGGSRGSQASQATPAEAALLAALIASPAMYDPVEHPRRAKERRDHVLQIMLDERMITRAEYEEGVVAALPDEDEVNPPKPDSEQPYFSSWLTQQLVDRYRPGLVFGGGLRIRTTLDPELQQAAEQSVERVSGLGPDTSLVAIENRTGEVKAMVGGENFDQKPFNLATNGHRQPGSAFKPFTLIAALRDGVSPDATFESRRKVLTVPGFREGKFVVHNYEDSYSGVASLRQATTTSDNSVYAELGIRVGTKRIARLARRMGIRTPLSTNPAMTLGGLRQGVTPLELAYAYSTIANKGVRVSGSLAPGGQGPVAVERVEGSGIEEENERRTERVFPRKVGELAHDLLQGVVTGGTGKAAAIGEFAAGKTGTTENYGDAWFVGFNKELTVAVWVGYADKLRPMETEYRGGPVAGGTYPAEIWRDFMTSWLRIREGREAPDDRDDEQPAPVAPTVPQAPATPPPQPAAPPQEETRRAPQPAEEARPQPPPPPHPPPRRPPRQAPPPEPAPTPEPDTGGPEPPAE